MNQFFQFIIKLLFLFVGVLFFLALLFIAAVGLLLFWVRSLWYLLTGKKPKVENGFKVNPKDGFDFFYTRATKQEKDAPRPSQRPLDDVSDAEIKEIKKPNDIDL